MKERRRKSIDPARAREADTGNWYSDISVSTTGWPNCSRCGVRVSVVDHRTGECLRCKMTAKAETRKQEAAG
jgi:hypothetical protein